jgi:hypothetical protein
MAVLCAWLAWNVNTVHQRQNSLAWVRTNQVGAMLYSDDFARPENAQLVTTLAAECPYVAVSHSGGELPYVRRLLGDQAVLLIGLTSGEHAEEMRRLFPEAAILTPSP